MSDGLFHVPTAFLVMAILGLVQVVGSWVALRTKSSRALSPSQRLWLAGNLAASAMACVIALRGAPAALSSLLTSHALMLIWLGLSWTTLRLERGAAPRWILLALVTPASVVIYGLLLGTWGEARATAYPAAIALMGSLAVAWQARRLGRAEASTAARLMAIAFSLTALVLLVRALDLVTGQGPRTSVTSGPTQVLMALGGISVFVLGNLGYLGLQLERLARQRLGAEVAQALAEERTVQSQERTLMMQGMLQDRELLIHRLQRLDAVQQQAVVMAALPHELRQPLSALRLNLDTLARSWALRKDLPPGGLEALGEDLQRMAALVEQFMGLLAAEAGGDPPLDPVEAVDLAVAARGAMDAVGARAGLGGVRLSLAASAPAIVTTNPTMVRQVLLVLLTNALDSVLEQPQPREITVEVLETAGQVLVRVADNGGGVAPHLRPYLFQPFASSKDHGTGIGLALAWRLACHCRADLSFRPASADPDRPGAVFSFSLPMSPAAY